MALTSTPATTTIGDVVARGRSRAVGRESTTCSRGVFGSAIGIAILGSLFNCRGYAEAAVRARRTRSLDAEAAHAAQESPGAAFAVGRDWVKVERGWTRASPRPLPMASAVRLLGRGRDRTGRSRLPSLWAPRRTSVDEVRDESPAMALLESEGLVGAGVSDRHADRPQRIESLRWPRPTPIHKTHSTTSTECTA